MSLHKRTASHAKTMMIVYMAIALGIYAVPVLLQAPLAPIVALQENLLKLINAEVVQPRQWNPRAGSICALPQTTAV